MAPRETRARRRWPSIPRTLRGRLVLAAVATILAGTAVFAIAAVAIVDDQLRGSLDRALRDRAQQVAQLAVSAPAVLSTPGTLESPVSGRQIVVEVIDAHGRILARSLTLGARLLPQDRAAQAARIGGHAGFEDVKVSGRQFRLYAAPIADVGGPAARGAVLVASDTTDIADTIHHLGVLLALLGAAVALVAAAVAALLSGRALRPLRNLASAAGEIERTADPSKRLPVPVVADEIAQLSGVLNRMLAALQRAGESERRFLADASHELRTPVTALLGNVEYAARHGAEPEVLEDLRRDANRLAHLVDDLLVLERAGVAEPALAPVALDQLVRGIVEDRRSRGEPLTLAATEPVQVQADAESLRRALENLIENAFLHGPPGSPVMVAVRSRDRRALITVADQGPGPDPADHEHLFERFWRGPGASERPGSGLGLSIVAALIERQHGRVSVDGATFTVELPELP